MARGRQRAKERQAERRAARLAAGGSPAPPTASGEQPPTGATPDPVGTVPPEQTGRSDTVVESPPPAPDTGVDDWEPDTWDEEAVGELPRPEDQALGEDAAPDAPPRGRVLTFLGAVWAELQRVQWPDRPTLTTLTGVVLGFVVIAGGYLGLLDLVFSRLIRAIL